MFSFFFAAIRGLSFTGGLRSIPLAVAGSAVSDHPGNQTEGIWAARVAPRLPGHRTKVPAMSQLIRGTLRDPAIMIRPVWGFNP